MNGGNSSEGSGSYSGSQSGFLIIKTPDASANPAQKIRNTALPCKGALSLHATKMELDYQSVRRDIKISPKLATRVALLKPTVTGPHRHSATIEEDKFEDYESVRPRDSR